VGKTSGDNYIGFKPYTTGGGEIYTYAYNRPLILRVGNVGIGTTEPAAKLHVKGYTLVDGDLMFGNDPFENKDTLSIRRVNIGSDRSELRIEIGDNARNPATCDQLNIGAVDYNTGIWYPRMTVLSTGNVGIGTTEPSGKLSIYKGSNDDILRLASPSGSGNYSGIRFEGTVGGWGLAAIRALDAGRHNGDLIFYTDGDNTNNVNLQERVIIKSSGNVGIGTTSPSEKLEVNGTVKATKFVGDGSGLTNLPPGDGHSLDAADGSPKDAVYVDNAGNVGIGTARPGNLLHIADPGNPAVRIEGTDINASPRLHFESTNREWAFWNENQNLWSANGYFHLIDWTANQSRLTVDTNGNVGIGTTDPVRPLSVIGDGHVDGDFRVGKTSGDNYIGFKPYTTGGGEIYTYAYNRPLILRVGNVGIGTTEPKAKLDVDGNMNIRGILKWGVKTVTAGPYGGSGGTESTFNVPEGYTLSRIVVRHGAWIDSIKFEFKKIGE
jgi:hypothetical protein